MEGLIDVGYTQLDLELGQAFSLGDRVRLPGASRDEAIVVGYRPDGWLDVVEIAEPLSGERSVGVYSPRNLWKVVDPVAQKLSEDAEADRDRLWETLRQLDRLRGELFVHLESSAG